jgi:hypothetical protein
LVGSEKHVVDGPDDGRLRSGRNAMALVGFYSGLLAVTSSLGGVLINEHVRDEVWSQVIVGVIYGFGGVGAVFALVFSVLGLARAKRYPDQPEIAYSLTGLVLGIVTIFGLIVLTAGAWLGVSGP